jgi:hypothetical protein
VVHDTADVALQSCYQIPEEIQSVARAAFPWEETPRELDVGGLHHHYERRAA